MNRLRVALDTTTAISNLAGSGVYTAQLADALRARDDVSLLRLHAPDVRPPAGPKSIADRARTLMRDLWWSPFGSAIEAGRAGCQLLHMPASAGPWFGLLPMVVTVHDLTVLRFPERFPVWHRNYARVTLPRVTRHADAVITGSNSSKADLVTMLGVEAARVHVVPYAVRAGLDSSPAPEAVRSVHNRYSLPDRFILTVGSVEPRKNLVRLAGAVGDVATRAGARDVQLVHVGPQGWHMREIHDDIAAHTRRSPVRFLGAVPTADLAVLYAMADVVAYPSLFEGFGYPVIEAMASGTPVLTSTVSSLPEVAGDAAVLVDPLDRDAIADGLFRLWTDPDLRERLTKAGLERAATYTPALLAERTVAVYRAVLGLTGGYIHPS